MSQLPQVENVKQVLATAQVPFDKLAKIHGAVNWEAEASFALEAITKNEFLMKTAVANQDSFKRAIINVAGIGLTLNPLLKLAYLVPRKEEVVLDISYQGYIKLATDAGSIKWAAAEIVYSGDNYKFRGHGHEPLHEFNPFLDMSARGELVGAYCLAKTHDNEFILTQMSAEEIQKIRDRSDAYKAFTAKKIKSTPWDTDLTEMIKKTVVRRAWKAWPKSDTRGSERMARAIEIGNDFEPEPDKLALPPAHSSVDQKLETMRKHLITIDRTEEKFLENRITVIRRQIKSLAEMTEQEMDRAIVQLESWVEAHARKAAQNENAS